MDLHLCRMIEDRRFHATRSSTYHTFDAILGHISVSTEIYGSSWSCTIIITYSIHTRTFTCSLLYHDTSVEPLWIHLARPSRLGIRLLSCFLFRDTSLGCVDLIYITEITCSMIDDSMSPDSRSTVHPMLYWGIYPFQTRSTDLHGVACLSPLARCRLRWLIGSLFYHGLSVEPLLSHSVRPVFFGTYMSSCFLLGYVSLICGSDSVMVSGDQDCIVDDLRLFDFFPDLSHIWFHTGAYFLFGWDL